MTGDRLRIVLLGPPLAGKTSLLAALVQASHAEKELLGGRLSNVTEELESLRRQLYESEARCEGLTAGVGSERGSSKLLFPFSVTFETLSPVGNDLHQVTIAVILLECGGESAKQLLTRPGALAAPGSLSELAHAVSEADALLLLVDATAIAEGAGVRGEAVSSQSSVVSGQSPENAPLTTDYGLRTRRPSPASLSVDLAPLVHFLHKLQENRGRRAEVAGLPIYLVLTKCDLLAASPDAFRDWTGRIEELMTQVKEHFRDFLADASRSPQRAAGHAPVGFGTINLQICATSIKTPSPLAERTVTKNEARSSKVEDRASNFDLRGCPYGVAELFHQVFLDAYAFRRRRMQAARRLFFALAGCVAVFAAMTAGAFMLLSDARREDPKVRELLTAIDSYRARESATPSGRLREPLQTKISELTDLKNRPAFVSLSQETVLYVQDRLQELAAYKDFKEKLAAIQHPAKVKTEAALDEAENALQALQIPADHAPDWSQTEAVLARNQRLQDCHELRRASAILTHWYNQLLRRGQDLWTLQAFEDRGSKIEDRASSFELRPSGSFSWSAWQAQVQALLEEAQTPPRLNPAKVGSFLLSETVTARMNWETLRTRLLRLYDLSTALGLAGNKPGRSPLDIPPESAGRSQRSEVSGHGSSLTPDFRPLTSDDWDARAKELESLYPRYREEFTLAGLPETPAAEIRRSAAARYLHLIRAGRAVVLNRLKEVAPGTESETLEGWRRLVPWLEQQKSEGGGQGSEVRDRRSAISSDLWPLTSDLRGWRVLALVLARLQAPQPPDPIDALIAFLKKDQFELTLTRLVLEVPDKMSIRPDGKWTIYITRRQASAVRDQRSEVSSELRPLTSDFWLFEPTPDERHDLGRQVVRYNFRPSAHRSQKSEVRGQGSALTPDLRPLTSGSHQLTYRPGDSLWADLPVKKSDGSSWLLIWATAQPGARGQGPGASPNASSLTPDPSHLTPASAGGIYSLWQIDCLTIAPRLMQGRPGDPPLLPSPLPRGQRGSGEGGTEAAEGVIVEVVPQLGIPTNPDLLPR